jgi:hypothetical protein
MYGIRAEGYHLAVQSHGIVPHDRT